MVTDEDLERLAHAAHQALTNPEHSKFHVRAAALLDNGNVISGGNFEYGPGPGQALHAEESLAAIAGQQGALLKAVYFEKDDITPCGNCRDVLLAYGTEDLVIANAVEITPFSEYLFFTGTNPIYSIDFIDEHGESASGSIVPSISYHSILPIQSALPEAYYLIGQGELDPETLRLDITANANVRYKDRQALGEFAKDFEIDALPITIGDNHTTHVEWIPKKFSFEPDRDYEKNA